MTWLTQKRVFHFELSVIIERMNESLMEPTQRSIPVQKRALEKYELILKVSCELLEERGFAGMSTREISRRAGCNIATVYRYFDGVNDIIKALGEPFLSGVSELFDQMSALLIKGGSLESAVQLFIEVFTQELKQNRWVLYGEAGVMSDPDLIVWDQQLMQRIESKLSGVLAVALPESHQEIFKSSRSGWSGIGRITCGY